MHPRNIYRNNPPDFTQLAQQFELFRPFVRHNPQGKPRINFKDPEALPSNRLCPPVPNRLDYILWIEDILQETMPETSTVHGYDIGVGASCIYPLLGCARNPNWEFTGTDIDDLSVKYAKENVALNNLQARITIRHNVDPNHLFLIDGQRFAFSMCNPPFFGSQDELEEGLLNKEAEPSSICTGSENEMITKGGEFRFISQMIRESLTYRDQICWYTSLIGLKKTIRPIIKELKANKITNYVVTKFRQGYTTRWAVAWSFGTARINKAKTLDGYHSKSQFDVKLDRHIDRVREQVVLTLVDLEIPYDHDEDDEYTFEAAPKANTWSRAARRQRKKKQKIEERDLPLFSFRLGLEELDEGPCRVVCSWLRGDDRDVFESFWGHIRKRLEESCGVYRGTAYKGDKDNRG
ncbi:hypothetical protein BX666DRAFT_1849921 [Dichotomocladium elegans]|nr:hypothetical protein BX666DRAFT_1849921 [Dichotomocladium elegans]